MDLSKYANDGKSDLRITENFIEIYFGDLTFTAFFGSTYTREQAEQTAKAMSESVMLLSFCEAYFDQIKDTKQKNTIVFQQLKKLLSSIDKSLI